MLILASLLIATENAVGLGDKDDDARDGARPLDYGVTLGSIDRAGDRDWYSLRGSQLGARRSYLRVKVRHVGARCRAAQPLTAKVLVVVLYRPGGSWIRTRRVSLQHAGRLRTPFASRGFLLEIRADDPACRGVEYSVWRRKGLITTTQRYGARIRGVLMEPEVGFLSTNHPCNCVRVGVADAAAADRVKARARRAGVPRDKIQTVITSAIQPLQVALTLRDPTRPIMGGFQIQNEDRDFCTMFGTVFHDGRLKKGLLTNAHCTRTQFADDGIEFFQAGGAPFSSDFVAREVLDPPGLTSLSWPPDPIGPPAPNRCPAGATCRFSDAAFAEFDTSTVGIVGRIARPFQRCAISTMCSLQVIGSMDVAGRSFEQFHGQRVAKLGRTTGWTTGPVIEKCADVPVHESDPPIVLICQNIVRGVAAGGDSGSPVFQTQRGPSGLDDAVLAGILWGGTPDDPPVPVGERVFVYSPLTNVEADLGTFQFR